MHRSPLSVTLLLSLTSILGATTTLRAQAIPSATKHADLSAFAGYSRSNPDYGPFNNQGISAGADYTRFFGWRVAPSLEVRGDYNTGSVLTRKSALAGIRLGGDVHRFHPYADLLAGGTWITFAVPPYPGYTQDAGFAYSLGGGVDIDAIRHFQVKLDFQQQMENYGVNVPLKPTGNFTLSPTILTVGVVYRIPFRMHNSQRDNR